MNRTAMKKLQRILRIFPSIIAITLMINGCTVKKIISPPSYPQPAPSHPAPAKPPHPAQPVPSPVPAPAPIPTPAPLPPQEPAGIYRPKTGPAGALYASAQQALDSGSYQQAEMAMERALRIEPRNGHYWYTMAQVKYRQGQYSQAVHFCSKSKSFAGRNTQLLRVNDELIQRAQQQMSN